MYDLIHSLGIAESKSFLCIILSWFPVRTSRDGSIVNAYVNDSSFGSGNYSGDLSSPISRLCNHYNSDDSAKSYSSTACNNSQNTNRFTQKCYSNGGLLHLKNLVKSLFYWD